MSDEQTPSHSKLDTLSMGLVEVKKGLDENTKATIAMSSAIRMIYLVPLALAAMGLSAWLLVLGKLGEWNFMSLALVCLSPFFGEGIGRVLERMPLIGKKADTVQKVIVALCILGALPLTI